MTIYDLALVLFLLSWIGVGAFQWHAIKKGRLESPSKHSAHSSVTPTGGGAVLSVLFSGFLVALSYYGVFKYEYLWLFLPGLVISLLGLMQDWKKLSSSINLIMQVVGIYISLYFMQITAVDFFPWFDLPFWTPYCILALLIMWVMRSVKLTDGIDGLGTSQALIFFGVSGLMLFNVGYDVQSLAYHLSLMGFGLFALLAGFLFWNWPGAKIFMGEAGSSFLGFVMAIFVLVSYKSYSAEIPLEVWLILSAIFWFDPTITLIRTLLAGKNPFKEHSNHAYERLLKIGMSHKMVLVSAILVNGIMATLAYWAYLEQDMLPMITSIAFCFIAALYLLIESFRPMHGTWYKA